MTLQLLFVHCIGPIAPLTLYFLLTLTLIALYGHPLCVYKEATFIIYACR